MHHAHLYSPRYDGDAPSLSSARSWLSAVCRILLLDELNHFLVLRRSIEKGARWVWRRGLQRGAE